MASIRSRRSPGLGGLAVLAAAFTLLVPATHGSGEAQRKKIPNITAKEYNYPELLRVE